jgi:membrane associated rhomboid family serine protease
MARARLAGRAVPVYPDPMLFPLSDVNPTRSRPWVTYGLVGANVLAYLMQMGYGLEASVWAWGLIPLRLLAGGDTPVPVPGYGPVLIGSVPILTLLTSMFMHGGLLHLGGNMLYLWIFGNNVEDRLGHLRFLLFYLAGGVLATLSHVAVSRGSALPLVGASGAVAAVLGAYWRLYPRARVRCLLFLVFIVQFVELPAALVLGLWILLQVINGVLGLGVGGGGVAWFAHIGGFLAGLLLLFALGVRNRRPRPAGLRWGD